ncbi:MAG: hypothetical protein P8183_09045 [Anaerolineae bacterium]
MNGDPIPAALRGHITGITYQNGMEGADRVEVNLANPNLRWLDHALLQMDNGFKLSMGYAGELEEMFVGEITGVNASFPNGGMPTLTVVAQDFLHRLTTGTKDRAFSLDIPCIGQFPLPDPAVAALVAGTNLLLPALDPVGSALSFLTLLITYAVDPLEAKRSIREQRGQSDFEFLTNLAKENGWELYIDHTLNPKGYVLRFQFLVQDYSPEVILKWGESLNEFSPRISTVGQVVGVSTRIWVPSIKMEFVIVLSWDYDRAAFDIMVYPGLGKLEDLMGSAGSNAVVKVDAIGPAVAPRKLLSELLPRLNNRLTGSGSAIGNTKIRAGRVIQLDGLGETFGGKYRITSATHRIDSGGYQTSFEGRKEVWFGSIPTPEGAGGLFRVQGQTIG